LIPNANLLGQPVQDIKGLTPSLRREIADAQYLKEKLAIENKISKFFLSIWGLTTGYGQSLIRLTTVSISLILFCTFIFILGDGNLGTWPTNFINGLPT
jgi:hypothetical protein